MEVEEKHDQKVYKLHVEHHKKLIFEFHQNTHAHPGVVLWIRIGGVKHMC